MSEVKNTWWDSPVRLIAVKRNKLTGPFLEMETESSVDHPTRLAEGNNSNAKEWVVGKK